MLIIGHRGAAGLAPENTLESFRAGYQAGADMLELDVRVTADKQLVVVHDPRLVRTHHRRESIASLTYEQLCAITTDRPMPLLEDVLDEFFGKIYLNIELKSRGSGDLLVALLKRKYAKRVNQWDNVIISSFKATELMRIRRQAKHANLALLHGQNPFIFIAYHRFIKFTAVGFHRLYLNRLALEIAKRAGIFIYVYTVDRPKALAHLKAQHVEGIVTNYPNKFTDEDDRPLQQET